MARSRVILQSASISSHTAEAVWNTDIQYKKEKDQVFYRLRLAQDMTFRGLTYSLLAALDVDECEEITVQVQRECGGTGVYSVFLSGHFNAGDWRDNQDDCEITVTVKTADDYDCLLGVWEIPVNLYGLDVVAVYPYPVTETYVVDCLDNTCATTSGETIYEADPENWCDVPESDTDYGFTPTADCIYGLGHITCWHRLEGEGSCSGSTPVAPSSDDYWTLLEDNCPTGSSWWRCPGGDVNITNARMPYGRLFSDVLQAMFDSCGLTVASDFFNINPPGDAPSNAAYDFAVLYLQNMTVHQKSDVKRPYSSDPALSKQWDMQPKALLDDLRILFNVYWEIDGTDIRIEHISYFSTTGGLDASADPQQLDTERQIDDNIKYEYFSYVDDDASDYFLGSPIVYDCGTEKKDNQCQLFSTDVTLIQNTNSEGFSDENFVLCSTEVISTVHYLIRDNRPLAFTELHDSLHRHYRYWKNGTMNGDPVTFTTYRPTRRQPAFDHVLCCDDPFNEREPVTTGIGAGYIENAIYNIENDVITLETKH